MPTGNSKFPWLNQKYVMEIEQRTANVPAWVKEIMQQKMYSDFYAQQKREEEQAERMAMKNQITQKELEAKSDEKAALRITNKKATLADGLRNFYKLNLSDWDDDTLISKFTSWIKDWDKMYIDYLNGDNNDIMVKTGLFWDTFKQLNEKQKVGMTPNVSNTVTEAQNNPKPTNLTSTSHFDDPEYAAHYLQNVDKEYKPFVDAAKQSWYPDWMVASMVDASKTYQDFLQRGFWDKAEEVNVGTFQGFVNFFGNAYNNLAGNNPYVWIAPKLNMQSIQFKDDLLGAWNNYGDLRASSWWTKWGEIFGDLLANTAVMMLLPWLWGETKMESIAESALNNGTKWVVRNLTQRGIYGAAEWAEFGALATMGQENADLNKLSTNMMAWGGLWSVFWVAWGGLNAYKYRNILKSAMEEWDKAWTVKNLLTMYDKWVRPTSRGMKTNTQLQQYDDDALWAVETIVKNKEWLRYIDVNWEETFGHLPRNLDEFSQAIKQSKQSIYNRYSSIAREAGKTTEVDTSDIVKELKTKLADKEWRVWQSEATISRIEKWIKDLESLNNKMSVEWTQTKIQELNEKLQAFLKNQNPNDVGTNAVDWMVLNGFKKWVDDAIENAGLDSEEYFALRNAYKQLKTIESDVNHRAIVYGRQNPESLVDSLSNLSSIDAIAKFLKNPKEWALKFAGSQLEKLSAKNRNNPNKMIDKMFREADDTISKSETLKTQSQIAWERTQKQAYNIRKNRAQRLQERQEAYNSKEQARQALLEKQQQQEAAYQEWKNSKIVDENGNLRDVYHGTPEKTPFTEFDESLAWSNVHVDKKWIYFTDNPDFAEQFAHEQLPWSSNFTVKLGERGHVYRANLNMENPLDLNTATPEELLPFFKENDLRKSRDRQKRLEHLEWHPQSIKFYIDMDKVEKSGYDGIIAKIWKESEWNEYIVFKWKQAKNLWEYKKSWNIENQDYNYSSLDSNQIINDWQRTTNNWDSINWLDRWGDQGMVWEAPMTDLWASQGWAWASWKPITVTDWNEMVNISKNLQSKNERWLFMDVHTPEEYGSYQNFTNPNKSAAISVKPDWDIINFVSTEKWAGKDLMLQAIEAWGNKMDNYWVWLTHYYENFGFEPVARVKFNREYAPEWWNFARDWEPDIFVMKHNGESPAAVREKYGTYKHKTPAELEKLPEMDYDTALKYRDNKIKLSQKPQSDLKTSEDVLKYSQDNKDTILELYRAEKWNYVNPDDFRDFINDSRRLLASETQDWASWLAEQYFDQLIKENPWGKGLVIAGWPWGWKGTSLKVLWEKGQIDTKGADIIVDKTKWTKEIKKMRDNWMKVEWDVVVPNADWIVDNIIWRAVSQNIKDWLGKWRTLPINWYWIPTHKEVAQIAKELYKESKNSKDLIVRFIDNTWKKEEINIKEGIEWLKLIESFEWKLENITESTVKKSVDAAYKKWDITKKQRDDLIKWILPIVFVWGLIYWANEES